MSAGQHRDLVTDGECLTNLGRGLARGVGLCSGSASRCPPGSPAPRKRNEPDLPHHPLKHLRGPSWRWSTGALGARRASNCAETRSRWAACPRVTGALATGRADARRTRKFHVGTCAGSPYQSGENVAVRPPITPRSPPGSAPSRPARSGSSGRGATFRLGAVRAKVKRHMAQHRGRGSLVQAQHAEPAPCGASAKGATGAVLAKGRVGVHVPRALCWTARRFRSGLRGQVSCHRGRRCGAVMIRPSGVILGECHLGKLFRATPIADFPIRM